MTWTAADIPDQSGRTIVVTGANSGIGLEATKSLAAAGAHVTLACRDPLKADEAAEEVRATHGDVSIEVLPLDLASLASVRDFAKTFADRHARLDVLINNAGVMAIPRRSTADGFEMQLGTNHLGHFALTGLLLDRILAAGDGARIVNVSSTAHKMGRMQFDDLHSEKAYSRWGAYGQSKLANLLFTADLQRRLNAAGHAALATACHPGWAATNLQVAGPKMDGSRLMESLAGVANRLFSQDAAMGSLPTLYAATAASIRGGDYVGPDGFAETWGHPTVVKTSARARDREAAARLWDWSESQTGVSFGLGPA